MPVNIKTASGGGVILQGANTASDKTMTVPADDGTIIYSNSSGNVGIGTSSPFSLLDIRGSSNGQNVLQLSNSAGSSDGTAENQIRVTCNGNNNWGNLDIQAYTTIFTQNNTERARIDASGNLLVGTTSSSQDCRTHIYKTVTSGDVLRVQNASGNTGVAYIGFRYGTGTGTETGYISTNGSTTSYVTTSDYRLKENVQPMVGALARVAALRPSYLQVESKWRNQRRLHCTRTARGLS